MDQLPSHVYMSTQLKVSRIFGIWPYPEGTPLWKKVASKFVFYVLLGLKVASSYLVLYHIYYEWGHLPDPIDTVINITAHFNTTFGMMYIPCKIKKFQALLKLMDRTFMVSEDKSEDDFEKDRQRLFERAMKSAAFVTKLFISVGLMTGVFYSIQPLGQQDGERKLPYRVTFPFGIDVSSGTNYWLAYSLLMANFFGMCINGTINCDMFVSLIIKTTCQFSFLKHMLLNIRESVRRQKNTFNIRLESADSKVEEKSLKVSTHKEEEDKTSKNEIEFLDDQENELIVKRLNECLKFHQDMLLFVKEMDEHVSLFMLAQIGVYVGFLCMNIFALSIVPMLSPLFLQVAMFITSISCLLLVFSWYGNELQLKSLEVADAAYNCDWVNGPEPFKKSLIMLIWRAQKPVKLTAWKFFTVDLNLFITVMKTSYSYYQVMHTMYSEE
ncbi:Odorant receptor 62 [Blattella germanica]|nr:Odorant receptor 62 [Blattella germanica]